MRNLMLRNVRRFLHFCSCPNKFEFIVDFCDICGDKTLLKPNLESHMKTHKTAKPSKAHKRKLKSYSCQCGKEFKSRSQLVDHTRRIHETVRDYQCQYCSNFYAKRELSVHVKRVHMKGENVSKFKSLINSCFRGSFLRNLWK